MDMPKDAQSTPAKAPEFVINTSKSPVITTIQEDGRKITTMVIAGCVSSPEHYAQAVNILYQANRGDQVKIILVTPGGAVSTGCVMADAILSSKAEVTGIANGECASCGAFILGVCDNIEVRPWGSVMFHGSSHFDMGKTATVKERAENTLAYIEYLYSGFIKRGLLTEEEYLRLRDKKEDIYLSAEELNSRLGGKSNE